MCMRREVGGRWESATVGETTEREIDAIVDSINIEPASSVQIERGYRKAVARARLTIDELAEVHDDSVTIPIRVVPFPATP